MLSSVVECELCVPRVAHDPKRAHCGLLSSSEDAPVSVEASL